MSVDVVPDIDVVITTSSWSIRSLRVILLLAVMIIAITAAGVLLFATT